MSSQRAKDYLDRYEQMYKEKLVAKQDYDQKKADYESALASVSENEARLAQAKSQRMQTVAQLTSAQRRVTQAQAALTRLNNVLARFDVIAPLDGVVTDLPVRVGETVVQGVQNSAGSTIMTIADMSLITAEVDVDETDVVSVQLGQSAEVTIEAMPNQTFTGKVIQIGDTAIVRSSGLAASQSATSTQEAKDFKVVVALDHPPDGDSPGPFGDRENHHRHAARRGGDSDSGADRAHQGRPGSRTTQTVDPNKPLDPAEEKARREEVQGVFIVKGDHAEFVKVDTGIAGATDIEVLSGLEPGDTIVTGSYKAIRSMRNNAQRQGGQLAPPAVVDTKS